MSRARSEISDATFEPAGKPRGLFFIGDDVKTDPEIPPRALSIPQAARTCNLSRATLYRLIADGRLATLKIGARRLVPVGAIDSLLTGGAPNVPK